MSRCLGCMEIYDDNYDICPHCGYVKNSMAEEAIHMEPGTLLANRYIVGKVLGFGGFGVTYIGYDGKLGQKVAIKEYLPSEFATRMPGSSMVTIFEGDKRSQFKDGMVKFVEEARKLAKFQNEGGIVHVMDSFIENETAYIIMELLEGETLADRLKREGTIPEYEAIELLKPVMMSLSIVHREGILHRDISPDNIFLTNDGQVKLIDFGASRFATTSHSRSLTVIIKPGYSPEEQYRSRGDQGPWTDVYALGACLYKMITGKTPPDAMERRAKFEMKNKDILVLPSRITKKISVIHENAILNAMNVRVEDRTPDIQTFLGELTSDNIVKRRNGRIKKIDVYRWPAWFKASVAAILLTIVTTGALMATGVISVASLFSDAVVIPEGMAVVPDICNIPISRAVDRGEAKAFEVKLEESLISPYVEAGKVVYQEPKSGLVVNEKSIIKIYVSKGNGEIIKPVDGKSTVPFIVGSTENDAKSDLREAGLGAPEVSYEYDENITEGLVISQSKMYGAQLKEGSNIKMVVSKGPQPFELPSLYLMKKTDVEKTFKGKGLQIQYSERETPDYADGTVLEQDVAAGTMVKRFDTLNLVVAKSVWSDWSTTQPLSDKETESKTQYSYSDYKEMTQLDNKQKSGWTLIPEKTTTVYADDYGAWSDWSTSSVSATTLRKIDSRLEYRFRDKEFTTSKDSSLAGWTKTGTTTDYTDYGSWSGWSTTVANSSDTRKVESRTEYRKRSKVTQEFDSKQNTSGYTLVSTRTAFTDYGGWSGWQTDAVSSSELCDVQTRTTLLYHYWTCPNCGSHVGWFDTRTNAAGKCAAYGGGCNFGGAIPNNYVEFWDPAGIAGTTTNSWGGAQKSYGNTSRGKAYTNGEARTEYSYRTRSKITYYTYEYWGSWSGWSTTEVSKSSSRDVETRTVYRYADRSIIYTNSFERWGGWTDWSTNAATASGTKEVETRTLYRYAEKIPHTQYTLSSWTAPTEYSDNVATESSTRKVTTRQLYRYRTTK